LTGAAERGSQLGPGPEARRSVFGDNLLDDIIELHNASLVETEHFTTLGRPRTAGFRLRLFF